MISSEDLKLKYLSHIGSKNTYDELPELVGRKLKNSLNEEQIIRETSCKELGNKRRTESKNRA